MNEIYVGKMRNELRFSGFDPVIMQQQRLSAHETKLIWTRYFEWADMAMNPGLGAVKTLTVPSTKSDVVCIGSHADADLLMDKAIRFQIPSGDGHSPIRTNPADGRKRRKSHGERYSN